MRALIFLFFMTCFSMQPLLSCTCVGSSFCLDMDEHFTDDNDLIFLGSFIKSEEPIGLFVPMQYKIEELYSGEVVTPSSPLYNGEEFINTDSTVWILAGSSAFCMPDLVDQSAIMAVAYNEQTGGIAIPAFGYSNYACLISYLPVTEDGFVNGWIYDAFQSDTVSLEEFQGVFHTGCFGTNSTNEVYNIDEFNVLPQPTTGYVDIIMPDAIEEWTITLYDIDGRSLQQINNRSVDLSALNAGVYFMTFEKDRHRFTKRIVKI